jgi:hypothetical protein
MFNLDQLMSRPGAIIQTEWQDCPVDVSLGIPNYQQNLCRSYETSSGKFSDFQHFALIVSFSDATELSLHDSNMQLAEKVRSLVKEFGPIVFQNACLPEEISDVGHRNRFPHLNLHRDRNETQPTPYSLLYQNPFDAEQIQPRTATTLFISNQHARTELEQTGRGLAADDDLSHLSR